jgi:hypothetical protein
MKLKKELRAVKELNEQVSISLFVSGQNLILDECDFHTKTTYAHYCIW